MASKRVIWDTRLILKAPPMNSNVAFNHSLQVGAQWYNTPLKHWERHSASLEAEEIHTATDNFKEGASYQKTPFPWLVSAKRDIFLLLLNPQETIQCPFSTLKLPHLSNVDGKVVVNCMKNLVVDCFRLAESLKRLWVMPRTPRLCDRTCIFQRQKSNPTAINGSYYAQSQQAC